MALVLAASAKRCGSLTRIETPANLRLHRPENRIQVLGRDVHRGGSGGPGIASWCWIPALGATGCDGGRNSRSSAKKIVLDHHISEDNLGAEVFRNVRAEATGRLVSRRARPRRAADAAKSPCHCSRRSRPIPAGFVSRRPRATRFALGGAGRCRGAPDEIYNAIYEQDTLARVQLRGRILARTQTELDGRLVFTSVTREDFAATGAAAADTEDVVNMTLVVAAPKSR